MICKIGDRYTIVRFELAYGTDVRKFENAVYHESAHNTTFDNNNNNKRTNK